MDADLMRATRLDLRPHHTLRPVRPHSPASTVVVNGSASGVYANSPNFRSPEARQCVFSIGSNALDAHAHHERPDWLLHHNLLPVEINR